MKCQISKSVGIFLCVLGIALAYPVFEDDNGDLVELIPLNRVPRGAPPPQERMMRGDGQPQYMVVPRREPSGYEPMPAASRSDPIASETGHGHSHSPYDYVDYGAYTGGYGAFGWYTDHPVYTYGHGGY